MNPQVLIVVLTFSGTFTWGEDPTRLLESIQSHVRGGVNVSMLPPYDSNIQSSAAVLHRYFRSADVPEAETEICVGYQPDCQKAIEAFCHERELPMKAARWCGWFWVIDSVLAAQEVKNVG